jgi:hypothetical protein
VKNRNFAFLTPLLLAACLLVPVSAEKFSADDPIREDPDRTLRIESPRPRKLSKAFDFLEKTFRKPSAPPSEAVNVNTVGEVPDSSWYTNRLSRGSLSIDALVRGPNSGPGPDTSKPWTIIGAKTEGITPGLRIRDARGDTYLVKFDPLHWPQMATSAEVIGTKFFWALGYNVPENYLVHWNLDFNVEPGTEVEGGHGRKYRLTSGFVEDVLKNVPRRQDGSVQAVASKLLPGKLLGAFDFQGRRRDDPNDIFEHQDRRELRGYRVFCAWLNHNDSDSVNTLDIFHSDGDGAGFVEHYLIDFGTVMGSGAILPHARRVGNEYYVELVPSLKSAVTLGLWDRPWRHVKYREFPSVGRFESTYFRPELWKPDYPNPAFDRMTILDALWATRILARMNDEMIEAVVKAGQFDDVEAERHVAMTLIERRDKTVRHYLAEINPLVDFEVRGNRLRFTNLGREWGLSDSCTYKYAWSRFDNRMEITEPVTAQQITSETFLNIPTIDAEYLRARIVTDSSEQPNWATAVDVYLRKTDSWRIVGIERENGRPERSGD